MTAINPFAGMALVALCFVVVITGLSLARKRFAFHPEVSRKFVHVAMGLVTLTFPLLFTQIWAVWFLSLVFVVALLLFRTNRFFHQRFGQILGGVERQTWGEFYFPVAVAIVFTLSHRHLAWYTISLLVLTLADAAAAVVGAKFGRSQYRTEDGWKSIEGSMAFFIVALIVTFLAAAFLDQETWLRAAIIAACVGVLAALVEAISWRGLDNLFLPVATLAMLSRFAELDLRQLWPRPLVAAGLLVLMLTWRRRTTLQDDAVAGAALTLYLCWAIGGWRWLQPPLVIALAYTFLPFHPERLPSDVHGNLVIVSLAAAGFIWMFLEQGFHRTSYWLPYLLSFSVQLSMLFLARWKRCRPETSTILLLSGGAFSAWLFVFVPGLLLSGNKAPQDAAIALIIVAASTALFWIGMGTRADLPNSAGRWLFQSTVALLASCAGLLPIFNSCPT